MTLTKRKPWSQFFADPFFNDFPGVFERDSAELFPAINVIENKKEYEIELAVPGFKKGEFNIELDNGVLTVTAEHNEEKEIAEKNYKRKEFSYNSFKRSFSVPENIDEKDIEAHYDDGILKLELKKLKLEDKKEKRKIDVK